MVERLHHLLVYIGLLVLFFVPVIIVSGQEITWSPYTVLRIAGLLGFISLSLGAILNLMKKQINNFFGKPFLKIHHYFARSYHYSSCSLCAPCPGSTDTGPGYFIPVFILFNGWKSGNSVFLWCISCRDIQNGTYTPVEIYPSSRLSGDNHCCHTCKSNRSDPDKPGCSFAYQWSYRYCLHYFRVYPAKENEKEKQIGSNY